SLRDVSDVSHLTSQVTGHEVHAVRQILPGSGHTRHVGLTAKLPFGTHLTGHASYFGGKRAELIHHCVNGVLELQDFTLHVDGDLLRQVTIRYGRGHVGDVAHLAGQITRHGVHRVREILPRTRDAFHPRLATELTLSTHLTGDAGHFGCERRQLI